VRLALLPICYWCESYLRKGRNSVDGFLAGGPTATIRTEARPVHSGLQNAIILEQRMIVQKGANREAYVSKYILPA
jgi:hypothetical protein